MIKEFCDHCLVPIGKMHDGGKAVPKHNTIEVLAFIGQKHDYMLCPRCYIDLSARIDNFFRRLK